MYFPSPVKLIKRLPKLYLSLHLGVKITACYTTSMYLGVDVGGTKTLVAALDDNGVIIEKKKFETSKVYNEFLDKLTTTIKKLNTKDFWAAGVGIPAITIDRNRGRGINFGNLPWRDVDVGIDIEKVANCPVLVDNDAKLGALSEYMLLKDRYQRVLYIAPGTGIGFALINDGEIDASLGDGGGRTLLLPHKGKLTPWEDFASAKAVAERYHTQAKDLTDENAWRRIAFDLSLGFIELLALTQPQVIVIGGSLGTYFDRYGKFLNNELKKHETPLLPIPPIVQAQRPETAVVYGCYDYAKQVFDHAAVN